MSKKGLGGDEMKNMSEEMNNFHGYFPEGYKRQPPYNSEGRYDRIISDIDQLIIETGFDLDRYTGLARRYREEVQLFTRNFGLGEDQVRPHQKESRRLVEEMALMIRPIYEIMRDEKQYSQTELTS